MTLLNIFGGVALILFGVRFLGKGLDRLFGHNLIHWLHRMTQHRLKAFGAGMAVSLVAPSSTTLTLITLKMLHTGHLTAQRMLAVFLGTNVGVTITVQLLAFRVYEYFPLFLITGLIGFQFLERNLFRGIGQSTLAFGFIFLAMNLISQSTGRISGDEEVKLIIDLLHDNPLALIFISAVLTLMMQSSTATIGIGLALVEGGLGSLEFLIPVIIGSNLGIAGTALMAGFPTIEGRRLGTSNIMLKGSVALLCLLGLPFIAEMMDQAPGDEIRQAANFHTLFNVITGFLALPFLGPISKMTRFMIKAEPESPEEVIKPQATHLDEKALDSPSVGLINATRETLAMADEVKNMLINFWRAHDEHNIELAKQVQKYDDRIDDMNIAITEYLSRMSEEALSPQDARLQFALLNFTSELEAIGDIIDKNLCHQLIKEVEGALVLVETDHDNLEELYQKVLNRFEMAISILAGRDEQLAREMHAGKEQLNEWCREVQKEHYAKLNAGDIVSLESSSYFIDMMNSLRRVSSHLTSIAYSFIPKNDQ
ncbi:MAG: Na/Pi cotransporter family protein [Balneolales bacterium]